MTAENFPAQQMCCLLVNWSTGRFEYIFLNYYQCHKDCGSAWVASSAPARAPGTKSASEFLLSTCTTTVFFGTFAWLFSINAFLYFTITTPHSITNLQKGDQAFNPLSCRRPFTFPFEKFDNPARLSHNIEGDTVSDLMDFNKPNWKPSPCSWHLLRWSSIWLPLRPPWGPSCRKRRSYPHLLSW